MADSYLNIPVPTPTQNPVPSADIRDHVFGGAKIDEFVTSFALQYLDRFGNAHYTIEGLRWLAQQAISQYGLILLDSFQDGADITLPNQALRDEASGEYYRWDGPLPKHVDAGSTPASSGGVGVGAWVGVGDASLRAYLATVAGAASIGLQPGGNLQQAITWVTPEQFGAIGDGTVHPLSERYLTLSDAQAVYPFVTALTQTIDWAACQAADNYARGKVPVRCPFYANYHFGSTNYLSLGINSKWYGSDSTMTDSGGATMTRTNGTGFAFGQDAIVRVMDAAAAGSSDQFVRGIVFKGFRLTRGVARRSVTKGTSRIGLHLYNAIKAEIDITPNGNEYGLFGYVAWGHKITVRGDSNHKHLFIDAVSASPEYTPPGGEAVTACDIRIEADAGPFGVVLRKCKYTRIHGFVEGAIANASQPNYDYVNETAVAVTLIDCDSIDVSQLGIEAWQGVHLYASGSTVTMTESWTQDSLLLNTTGKHGAFQSMSALTGASELAGLPATNNSYFYALNMSSVTIKNMTCDMSGAGFANTFLCTTNEANSRILFENTKVYFGSSRLLHPLNGYWSNIDTINDPYIPSYLVPSGHTYIGRGKCIALDYTSTNLAADGTATITPPSGYRIIHTEAYLVTSSATQAASGAVTIKTKASDGSTITYQTGQASTSYAIYSRLTLQVTK